MDAADSRKNMLISWRQGEITLALTGRLLLLPDGRTEKWLSKAL